MQIQKTHYVSGLIISVFVALHLFNHAFALGGAERHIELMNALRLFYRNPLAETVLLLCVVLQIYSGYRLFGTQKQTARTPFQRLHIGTGLYLAAFLSIHVSAVLAGRWLLKLDTNFHFGTAGLNAFPANLFFIPYYWLAVFAFFGHLAAVHRQKMSFSVLGLNPKNQALILVALGIVAAFFFVYTLTNQFRGFDIPAEYNILIGR